MCWLAQILVGQHALVDICPVHLVADRPSYSAENSAASRVITAVDVLASSARDYPYLDFACDRLVPAHPCTLRRLVLPLGLA